MSINLAKFIPPEMRLEITQKVIEEKGIRPLARELDVNPKSVYKYKNGASRPGDEVMSKILTIANKEESIPLEEYLKQLKKEFLQAIKEPAGVVGSEVEEEMEEPFVTRSEKVMKDQEKPVVQEATPTAVDQKETVKSSAETGKEQTVDEKPTERVSLQELLTTTGVKDPFEQTKIEKIIHVISEEKELSFDDIAEITGISEEAIEKYLDKLVSEKFVGQTNSNTYKLTVNIEDSD